MILPVTLAIARPQLRPMAKQSPFALMENVWPLIFNDPRPYPRAVSPASGIESGHAAGRKWPRNGSPPTAPQVLRIVKHRSRNPFIVNSERLLSFHRQMRTNENHAACAIANPFYGPISHSCDTIATHSTLSRAALPLMRRSRRDSSKLLTIYASFLKCDRRSWLLLT